MEMTKSEYYKRIREIAKKEHRCIQCGQQDAFTLNGRSRCSRCAERARISDKKRYEKCGKERMRLEREKWASMGKCVRCRKDVPLGRRVCQLCVSETSSRSRERKIQDGMNWPRGDNGICWTCNKRPVIEDRKLCESCYQKTLAAQEMATEWHREHGFGPVAQSITSFWILKRSEYWWRKNQEALLNQKTE